MKIELLGYRTQESLGKHCFLEPASSPTSTSTGVYGTGYYGTAFFLALHRAVSASGSFILLLFIYWKFHVTDGQNRSLSFFGVKCIPTSFPFFCFCPSYFCPSLLLPPLNHSIDTSRCYMTFNILLSATSRSKRILDDQPTPRMLLSREQVSALLSRLPQRRYRIALPILLNTCGATSDPLTLMCLPKSRLNQTSHSTGPRK